ncbi:MAG: N-acetylneuraminate synthase [Epulopiscium sp. Nuni2H_MBin003]|nr:MAG: N-acetylneuraminate synthase [Epulopiscium sp. Nuni2H_MBin003]
MYYLIVEKIHQNIFGGKIRMYIVAEIGCNHNGDANLAHKMIEVAKKCGVDAVKFQTFNSKELISKYATKAEYQKVTTGADESQLDMIAKLELSHKDYIELKEFANKINIDIFSTAFDIESIDFLYKNGQTIWKIPSGEITNLPYLEKISTLNPAKIILSTGMSTIAEIRSAIEILGDKQDITILHCNTEYPTEDKDVNLNAILDLKMQFPNYEIGFSDHSIGITAGIASVAYNITFIEKHFTLDKNFYGPDHKASITEDELRDFCMQIRRAEMMLGNSTKMVTHSEMKNKAIARKSIVARKNIKQGETFSIDNITTKRPGNGISPMEWNTVLGKVAEKDFEADELLMVRGMQWQN